MVDLLRHTNTELVAHPKIGVFLDELRVFAQGCFNAASSGILLRL